MLKIDYVNIALIKTTVPNSTYPKGGVSCSKDSFVVNETLVFQIKFCGKSPALRVAAKRWQQWRDNGSTIPTTTQNNIR